MDRASSLAFQSWPCQWASIRQKRPRASGATLELSPGMSRSRKVRVNERIHRVHASGEEASHARGKPPRIQRRFRWAVPTSHTEKPATSTNRMRPARVSEIPAIRSQEALPRRRKTALRSGSSEIGRSTSRTARVSEIGQPLDFIEDDETFPAAQYPLRRAGQGLADGGPFEIEDGRGARPIRGDLSGEGCLADLPRSEKSHHRGLGETLENGSMEVRPTDLLLNIQWSSMDIQQ